MSAKKEEKKSRILTPKDEEFKKIFAEAIITIGYCEMYPDAPWCENEEEDEEWEEW